MDSAETVWVMARRKRDYEWTLRELVTLARSNRDFKSPCYSWYVNDWLGSTKAMMMEPEAISGYRFLLDCAWVEDDCGLPESEDILARLSRLNSLWGLHSDQVLQHFVLFDGRWYNQRLLLERKKQILMRKQRKDAAKRSAKSRGNKAVSKSDERPTKVPTKDQRDEKEQEHENAQENAQIFCSENPVFQTTHPLGDEDLPF